MNMYYCPLCGREFENFFSGYNINVDAININNPYEENFWVCEDCVKFLLKLLK